MKFVENARFLQLICNNSQKSLMKPFFHSEDMQTRDPLAALKPR